MAVLVVLSSVLASSSLTLIVADEERRWLWLALIMLAMFAGTCFAAVWSELRLVREIGLLSSAAQLLSGGCDDLGIMCRDLSGRIEHLEESGLPAPNVLEDWWDELGDIPIDDDENIMSDFKMWSAGTWREEIWHWFDVRYPGGVHALMFPNG